VVLLVPVVPVEPVGGAGGSTCTANWAATGAATTLTVVEPVIEGLVLLSVKVTVSVPTAPTVTWYVATPLVNVSVAVVVVDTVPSKVVTVIDLVPL
jgi:hypothetical protein